MSIYHASICHSFFAWVEAWVGLRNLPSINAGTWRRIGKQRKRKTKKGKKEIGVRMKQDIFSSFLNYTSSDEVPRHSLCPKTQDSWCFYEKATASNETTASHRQ